MTVFKRGTIHWGTVLQAQAVGREQFNEPEKPRLWLIVSDQRTVSNTQTVIACPITTGTNVGVATFRVEIDRSHVQRRPEDDRTDLKPSTVLVDQLRTMATARFSVRDGNTSAIGQLTTTKMADVDAMLLKVLALES